MKRILLTTLLAFNFVLPAQASDDLQENVRKVKCDGCKDLSLPRHEVCANRAYIVIQGTRIEQENAKTALLKAQRRQQAQAKEAQRRPVVESVENLPTQDEFMALQTKLYMATFSSVVPKLQQGLNLPIPEVLQPNTTVFVPCKTGLLVYKFKGITSECYTELQELVGKVIIASMAGMVPKSLKTAEDTRTSILNQFTQHHLAELEKVSQSRKQGLERAKEKGLPVSFINGVICVEANVFDNETMLLATWLVDLFQSTIKVDPTILEALKAGFENPRIVKVRDVRAVVFHNNRGVK